MSYKITEECISCDACRPECPVECIDIGYPIYIIDSRICTDCGTCAAVCPTGACIPWDYLNNKPS